MNRMNNNNVLYLPLKKKWFDMIASGEKTFPVVQDLIRRLRDELLPVKVEGDVQWGVNKVEAKGRGREGGWFVWMMNNKGVTKYACEEEVVDHAFDTEVKVTDKATGRIYTARVPAGGWAYVIIESKLGM